ncbi:MAG: hypothetical protein ABR544_00670, partial [Gammaproteobacteria bacterium]
MTLAKPIRWFLDSRIAAPDPRGRVRLAYRQVFILPTARGWGFALLLLLMLLGAINYNNSLGYGLTFLLAGLGQVALYHTYRNLTGLELRAGATREVCAGEAAGFELLLHNPHARDRPALQAALADAAPRTVGVPAGQTVSLWLQRRAPRRGRLQPGVLCLETRFPLGLFRAWSRLRLDQPAWVYPGLMQPIGRGRAEIEPAFTRRTHPDQQPPAGQSRQPAHGEGIGRRRIQIGLGPQIMEPGPG